MIWILYDMDTILYSCLLCASPSSFLFSLSLIVILPCMCRPSFGYVTIRLETQYSQHDSSIPVKGVLTDSVMDLIHLRVGGTSW